jgi:hypothetical protein
VAANSREDELEKIRAERDRPRDPVLETAVVAPTHRHLHDVHCAEVTPRNQELPWPLAPTALEDPEGYLRSDVVWGNRCAYATPRLAQDGDRALSLQLPDRRDGT